MERHYEGKKLATAYKRFRPATHPLIIERVMSYVLERHPGPLKLAVDVGCISGQNTLGYAAYFEKVMGIDISPSMIAEVPSSLPENVSFLISPAESLPFPDNSIDLVTASQCFHWFHHEQFNREMQRVLSSNGVIAILGHDIEYLIDPHDKRKSTELLNITRNFTNDITNKMTASTFSFFIRNASIPFPYADVVREGDLACDCSVSLAHFIEVLKTYSAYQIVCEEDPVTGKAIIEKVEKNLIGVLGVKSGTSLDDVIVTMRLNNFYIFGRKEPKF